MTNERIVYYDDIEQAVQDLEAEDAAETRSVFDIAAIISKCNEISLRLSQKWIWYKHADGDDKFPPESMERTGDSDGAHVPPHPLSDQSAPTGIERRLIDFCERWCNDVFGLLSRCHNLLSRNLGQLEIKLLNMDSARKHDPETDNYYTDRIIHHRTATEAALDELNDKLAASFTDFHETRHHFLKFRSGHGLRRNPKYDRVKILFAVGVIVLVIEAGLNGFMYARASQGGLTMGWLIAAAVSAFIVVGSYLTGLSLTYKNERRLVDDDWKPSPRRWLGWVGFVAGIAIVAFFILCICIYRDVAAVLDTASGSAMPQTIARIRAGDVLPQAEIESFVLLIINGIIMIVGLFKGYHSLDPVPDYRARAKQLAYYRQRLRKRIVEMKDTLGLTPAGTVDIDKALPRYSIEELNNLKRRYAGGRRALRTIEDAYESQSAQTETYCNDRMLAYRRANRAARPDTHPAPDYFDDTWAAPSPDAWSDDPEDSSDDVDPVSVANALAEHRRHAARILTEVARENYEVTLRKYVMESEKHWYETNQKDGETGP